MAAQSVTNMCVLLVDSDPRCSKKTLELLLDAEYRVVMASRGEEALATLRSKKRKVDLVVTRTQLPDMCAFKLVEKLDAEFNVAIIMICDYYHQPTILRGLLSGAMFCISYPLRTTQIRSLWQHAMTRERLMREARESGEECTVAELHIANFEEKLMKRSLVPDDSPQIKRRRVSDLEPVEGWIMGLPTSFNWTNDSHWIYLESIVNMGVDVVVPPEVFRRIGSPGLPIGYVKEKLQQHHLYLKGKQDLRLKKVINSPDPLATIVEQLINLEGYAIGELTYHPERPPMAGFLQNPQNLMSAIVFRRRDGPSVVEAVRDPPTALVGPPFVLPNRIQVPPGPVPFILVAQSSNQAPGPSTSAVAEAPPATVASPVPGRGGQAQGEQGVQFRG